MATQVVLLRGINVGVHNRVGMADLRELLSSLGYGDPRTLLQSGNVVLGADTRPEELARDLEREILGQFGVRTPVVVRMLEEIAAVVARDPLRDVVDRDKLYQVSFLSAKPSPKAMREIAAIDFGPERFVHAGREIYAWHPNGIHASPLAKVLSDKRLGVTATARNWNTTVKLLQLAREHEQSA
ncbi:MAG TPA: DUF1697 domain-containing protein [Solirubrobacteraceae bacterium]|jgi:uncharacterized protein (DUF1697 family)|nr:DUF1697 domain-containing protein [Solirubrobacteraceae bacterium]